jgi:hypothetical protein
LWNVSSSLSLSNIKNFRYHSAYFFLFSSISTDVRLWELWMTHLHIGKYFQYVYVKGEAKKSKMLFLHHFHWWLHSLSMDVFVFLNIAAETWKWQDESESSNLFDAWVKMINIFLKFLMFHFILSKSGFTAGLLCNEQRGSVMLVVNSVNLNQSWHWKK